MSIPTQFDPIGINDWIPRGYELIESVFFNGNSYIDTGFKQTQGDTYHVEIVPFVNDIQGGWGGCAFGLSSCAYFAIRTDGTYYFGLGGYFGKGDVLISERTSIELNKNGAFMNGVEVYGGTFKTVQYNWMLSSYNYSQKHIAKSRFFYGFIKRNERVVAEYFPLKRLSDNTFHIYDRVSKSFSTVIGDPLQE